MKAEKTLIDKSLGSFGKLDESLNFIVLWVTFIAFMSWAFLSVQFLIGPKSWLWLLIGAPLVIALLTLHSILLEAWREIAEIKWVKLFVRLISLFRNVIALLAMFRLAQAIN
jgi:hypothetical protein